MATISLSNVTGSNKAPVQTSNLKVPYLIWKEVDFAAAAAAKGSALAASDIIEAVRVPKDHAVLRAFVKKTSAITGTSTDLTLHLGITGLSSNVFGNGWDYDAAVVGTYGTHAGAQTPAYPLAASDTVDITIATQSGTFTGGKAIVYVEVVDLTTNQRGSIAQPKS